MNETYPERQVGNFRQAFSHLGIINAARVITISARAQAEGRTPGLWEPEPLEAAGAE